jgi:glycine cleavage system H protein
MPQIRFTKEHEWVRLEGDIATVGITDHAQQALGDLVFVELPHVGQRVAAGDPCAVVESVKAASDVYAPIAGTVTECNEAVVDDPAIVNASADENWFFKLEVEDPAAFDSLLDEADYQALVESL